MDSEYATAANPITVEVDYESASESEALIGKTQLLVEKGKNPDRVLSGSPKFEGPAEKVEILGDGLDSKVTGFDGKDDKVEVLGGGLSREVQNFPTKGGGELEKDEMKHVEVEESDGSLYQDEKKNGDFGGDVESEVVGKSPVFEGKEMPKSVEVEAVTEKNEKNDESLDEGGKIVVVATNPVIKPAVAAAEWETEMGKGGVNVTSDSNIDAEVETESNVDTDIDGSDQNLKGAVEELKPMEDELKATDADILDAVMESKAGKEENDTVVDEKEINVVGGLVEEETNTIADENFEEAVESLKPMEVEIGAVDAPKLNDEVEPKAVGDETKVADEKEDNVVDVSVEFKVEHEESMAVVVEGLGGAVEDLKPVEVEVNATDDEQLDDMVDSKAVDEKESKVDGGIVESKAVEDENNVFVPKNNRVADVLDANQDRDEANELKAVEKDIGAVETDKNGSADSTGPHKSLYMETEAAKAVLNSDQVLTELEAKLRDDGWVVNQCQNVEPLPALAENSKSKAAETEFLENSGVIKSGKACDMSIVDEDDDDDQNRSENKGGEEFEDNGSVSDGQPTAILDSSETAQRIIKEMEEGSSNTSFKSSRSYQRQMDGQIVSDSDEEVDTDEEGNEKEEFDSAALAALLKAATGGSSDGNITITSQDGTAVFSMDRPAGLGSSAPSLRPGPTRSARPTLFSPSELAVTGEPDNEMDEEERTLHEKVQNIRVKFLHLVMRLGHTAEDTVAAQVLYRLSLAEGIRRGRQMDQTFSIETAKKKVIQFEAEGEEDLNFSCNILVIGKTGVGKSATINSIFGEVKSQTNAFQAATGSVRMISGVVDGVKIQVMDTPGLKSSVMDQTTNMRILSSIKKYTKKCPPDIVLYVDRLDTQTRDFNDLPLLRSITSALGSSVWFNAIVALTHAASAPPEGPNGSALSYEVFIAQRSHAVQYSIRQAAGDMRLMNPVALVENHPSCRRNREGQRVLPNGLSWRSQLLLLCYSSKILSEANSLLKLQDPSPGKLFGFRLRSPPLPYLLSTLLQSRAHPKLPNDQGGDNGDSDVDLDDFSGAEDEEEDEYDQLPPFKPLKKSQIAKLTKEQKKAYFDEYDYRVKLLQKKQFKEEIRRLKEIKKRGKSSVNDSSPYGDMGEDFDQDGAPAAVRVPLPDMVLPPSFDCDVPTYRYRFLEPTSQLLTRPVLDTHGWDHDCGYDGVSLEESLAIADRFPASVTVQITKDKKDFTIHLDSSVATKHGENGSSLAGFDIQSVGKQLAYILRSETKFKNLKKNKTTAGMSLTFLGETVATGLKVEDQLMIGKRVGLVASTGAVRAQGDVAYGANLEAQLRERDYPRGQAISTLELSILKWRSDLALGANLQSQVNVGRNSKVAVRVSLNNKRSGQITVRTSSSEQMQLALVGIIPVAATIFRSIWPGESEYAP